MSRLTYEQIVTAITSQLQTQFPSVSIVAEDVTEGSSNAATGYTFPRPSFTVTLENVSNDDMLSVAERLLTCRILYFPTNIYTYSVEMLQTMDGLESAFNLNIPIQDRVLTLEDTRSQQIGDGTQIKVLEFSFDISWYDDPAKPAGTTPQLIENLYTNLSE